MFIGRERELNTLERLYASERFEFVVLYGRRRVGKTALMTRFLEGKRGIYFMGVESNAKQNLENLSRNILELDSGIQAETAFLSFQAALEYVFQRAERERLVLALDEYPYVARASKSLASTLQRLIDQYKDRSQLMLILCGSSMSYMEDHVLAYKAPLYGRRTAQMKLEPFGFGETCRCVQRFSGEDKALAYGVVGGTPQYVLQLDDRRSMAENIQRAFLDPSSILYEEPINLLKQEVRDPAVYTAVISAIAGGGSRLSEITAKVGEESSVCAHYIKNLMALGIVKRESPYGEKNSRRSIYSIADYMFRFWYRFVPGNLSMIARGASELAYQRVEPHLPGYMGKVFEDICAQYLWSLRLSGACPVEFSSLGRWWGSDPQEKKQVEIDLMGEQDKDTALFAECKWTNEKVGVEILETLVKRSQLFRYSRPHWYLFSKSGFTPACAEQAARRGTVSLVTYRDILRQLEAEAP